MRLRAFASNPAFSKITDKLNAASLEGIERPFSLLGNDTPLRGWLMFDLFQVFVLVDLGFELSDFLSLLFHPFQDSPVKKQ